MFISRIELKEYSLAKELAHDVLADMATSPQHADDVFMLEYLAVMYEGLKKPHTAIYFSKQSVCEAAAAAREDVDGQALAALKEFLEDSLEAAGRQKEALLLESLTSPATGKTSGQGHG